MTKNENFDQSDSWSNFSFFSLAAIFSKCLDGIKEKASTHQTR